MFDWVLNMPLHHHYDYIFFLLFAKLNEYVYRLHHADVMLTRSWIQSGVSASTRLRNNLNPSVYNSPSVVIHPSVCALVALFLYTLGKHNSSLFSKTEMISDENNSNFICMQRKLSGKMQKCPQIKLHNEFHSKVHNVSHNEIIKKCIFLCVMVLQNSRKTKFTSSIEYISC